MTITDRRKKIVEIVNRNGFVSVDNLSSQLGVSAQTVRRDIMLLDQRGKVVRHHGGVGIRSSTINISYQARHTFKAEAKASLADLLAASIPAYSSLFISGGTTMEAVARALLKGKNLKIITSSLRVAEISNGNGSFEVIVTAGVVRKNTGIIVGPETVETVGKFRCDFALLGCGGVERDGVLLDYDSQEVATNRAMIAQSRQVYVGADGSKFPGKANVRLAAPEEVDALFTERIPPSPWAEALADKGVEINAPGVAAEIA